jgi:hypothetical protein
VGYYDDEVEAGAAVRAYRVTLGLPVRRRACTFSTFQQFGGCTTILHFAFNSPFGDYHHHHSFPLKHVPSHTLV